VLFSQNLRTELELKVVPTQIRGAVGINFSAFSTKQFSKWQVFFSNTSPQQNSGVQVGNFGEYTYLPETRSKVKFAQM